jgi:hypothetical protein
MGMNVLDQAGPFLEEPIGKEKRFKPTTVPVRHAPKWSSYVVWKTGTEDADLRDVFVPGPNDDESKLMETFLADVKRCVHLATYKNDDSARNKLDSHLMSLSDIKICATRDYRCKEHLVALVPEIDIDPMDLEERLEDESTGESSVPLRSDCSPFYRGGDDSVLAELRTWPSKKRQLLRWVRSSRDMPCASLQPPSHHLP